MLMGWEYVIKRCSAQFQSSYSIDCNEEMIMNGVLGANEMEEGFCYH